MAESDQPQEFEIEHGRLIRKLIRAISNSEGNFALILVRCNSASLRDQIVTQLKSLCPIPIREVYLPHFVKTLYTTLQTELGEPPPKAVMIFGYEQVLDLEHLLKSANQVREEFRKNFPFPIVIWLNDDTFNKLSRFAPDFKSWAAVSIKFEISQAQLFQELEQEIDAVFPALLQLGAGRFQMREQPFHYFIDLDAAFHRLLPSTSPSLKANLAFLAGREADCKGNRAESRRYYEQSIAIWEGVQPAEAVAQIRYGCVLYYLGLWWRQYATQYRAEFEIACERAKNYYQQAIALFEQAERPDLVANFINALSEVLVRLKDWSTLSTVVQRAIQVQRTEPIRLAYSYGSLAELELQRSAWETAKRHAELALKLNDDSFDSENDWSWERKHYRGLYLVLLAEAQQQLGQPEAAIANLETARANNQPQYDPLLYVRILDGLRTIYFVQGEFWTAFEIKQEQRSIEQQYGLRAFVGAGRLQSRRQVMQPGFAIATQADVTQEIAASGRMQDVNRLVERIGRADHKLTVIYGQSGVGKSSLVQAGLLPVLKQQAIEARDVLPVLLQVYSDWAKNFGVQFSHSLEEIRGLTFPGLLDSMEKFIAQLRNNVDKNLLTVLIFDQFEEFFFAYRDPLQRRPFFEFLRNCLNIPYVKVILSLREDYLHYLLECNRLTQLDAIDNNILDKKILYYLGNFSKEDATSVIEKLAEISQLGWQPDLVEALVEDLAGELGEVRPIELQVVGAQLQTEQVLTLSQYQEHGPKEAFVERFLSEVVKDCGAQNEAFAKIILYLLTDENNTRPLKTRAELEADLQITPDRLELILKILVKSGLVFLIPGFPTERYQLVHDYLVPFIRQQQSATLVAELEKEREQRKLTEAKLNQALRKQLRTARRATVTFGVLTVAIGGIAIAATIAGINAYLSSLIGKAADQKQLDGVLATTQAGIKLKQLLVAIPGIRLGAVANMNKAVAAQSYKLTEINRLEGHQKSVTKLSFSPNGEFIASASEDKTIKIWKLNGQLVGTLQGHQGAITSVSFSRDGKLIASASEDKTVRIWRANGQQIKVKELKQPATSVSFRSDGKMIAIASADQTIKLWDLAGTIKELPGHTGRLTSVSFSSDGKLLASADDDDTVVIWDVNQGRPKNTINNYGTVGIQFSKTDQTLILFNRDQTTKHYKLDGTLVKKVGDSLGRVATLVSFSSDGQKIAIVDRDFPKDLSLSKVRGGYPSSDGEHRDRITALRFSPDNKILASASQDASIKLWNAEIFSSYSTQSAKTIKFSPDGNTVAVANPDQTIQLQDRQGAVSHTLSADGSILQFSPDSKLIVAASAEDIIRLKTTAGQKVVLRGHPKGIASMGLSPDGQMIVSAGRDQTLRFWRNDGTQIETQSIPNIEIQSIQFSRDSNLVLTTEKENQAKLWRRDGSLIKTLTGHTVSLSQVKFSRNSQLIATAGDDNLVNLWGSDGRAIAVLEGASEPIRSIEFSPNSQLVAAVSGGQFSELSPRRVIKLWTREGKPLPHSIDTYGTQEIRFSPDSQTIACRNRGKTVQLWRVDGVLKATLSHGGEVNALDFSPSGDLIATASTDDRVQLWDQTGTQVGKRLKHSGSVQKVSFSPDGQLIVSATGNGEVKLWNRRGEPIKTLQNTDNFYGEISVHFSEDSQRIIFEQTIYSTEKYTLKIWSRNGQELKPLQSTLSSSSAREAGISSNGQLVALVEPDPSLTLWNTQGSQLAVLRKHSGKVQDVKFNPSGNLLASSSEDQTINLWDRNGKLVKTLPAKGAIKSISFSPDGKALASAGEQLDFWSLEGKQLATYSSADPIQKIGYSLDGKTLAAAIQNRLFLFNADKLHQKLYAHSSSHPLFAAINSIEPQTNPIQHQDQVTNFQFGPKNQTVVTTTKDAMVQLWHLTSGRAMIPAIQGTRALDDVEIAKFSPDGNFLGVYGSDESIYIQILNKVWVPKVDLPGFGSTFEFSPDSQAVVTAYTNPDSQAAAIAQTSVVEFLNLNLDQQLAKNCQAMRDYLTYNQKLSEKDRHLCDFVGTPNP